MFNVFSVLLVLSQLFPDVLLTLFKMSIFSHRMHLVFYVHFVRCSIFFWKQSFTKRRFLKSAPNTELTTLPHISVAVIAQITFFHITWHMEYIQSTPTQTLMYYYKFPLGHLQNRDISKCSGLCHLVFPESVAAHHSLTRESLQHLWSCQYVD